MTDKPKIMATTSKDQPSLLPKKANKRLGMPLGVTKVAGLIKCVIIAVYPIKVPIRLVISIGTNISGRKKMGKPK